ncbi:tRNA (adenosine(37)-N6)-threonylcarbamoyltransferase complex ATPase subunit type 1 TsaE [Spiroplasma corruscae]|uniref:tRNA threonylcarbamoyladenosine biosynthesis protein TsaE n=1 Tax=Spiroplasma corruscae TaxID=216934 RepID=A0A222EQB1_9MOLU|nr:tRNA (adenosine(37)-N6)-threonylcarbamoyltransferase complex ATPase subunit type 1 TsaE [Spiroplasma corruscae]ASP28652.1 tRNA (adenosine(37)-N6)-threonylcarbamoyltransferase complex ATPase subunit type 1 TsaE [Spiroplasma corruscae]
MIDNTNDKFKEVIVTKDELNQVVEEISKYFKINTTILLYGGLGAGKTTFTKKLLESLGVKELVTSPTFTLMNQYQVNEVKINHIDAYRLSNTSDYDMFLEEMLDSFNVIEWPENFKINYSDYFNLIKIKIEYIDEETRKFKIIEGK